MKRLLFLIPIFCELNANSQTCFISFEGTGASGAVSTVKVENLTAGTTLTLNGSDILRLSADGPVGVPIIKNENSSALKIYPNPMNDNAILQITTPEAGNAIITIIDIAGKLLSQIQSKLDKGLQEFHLSGLKRGSYLISVKGNTYHYTGKLFCNSNQAGTINFEKVTNNQAVDDKISKIDPKGTQATVYMAFTPGDRIKYTAISGIYSTVKTDMPTSDKTITFIFISCTDGDGNNYPVVEIGTQVWTAENLKTTRYLNGDLIGTTTPATQDISGESTPKYQWPYDGNESDVSIYGRLYTWYAITDNRNVCPLGWHIPSDEEWITLKVYLVENVAGGKLKETGTVHWQNPNSAATNETGFTGLPGGAREPIGTFSAKGIVGFWWSTTIDPTFQNPIYFRLHYQSSWLDRYYDTPCLDCGNDERSFGFSVRCIRN